MHESSAASPRTDVLLAHRRIEHFGFRQRRRVPPCRAPRAHFPLLNLFPPPVLDDSSLTALCGGQRARCRSQSHPLSAVSRARRASTPRQFTCTAVRATHGRHFSRLSRLAVKADVLVRPRLRVLCLADHNIFDPSSPRWKTSATASRPPTPAPSAAAHQ